ncbi:amino acid permease [Alicyclobacillus tolerans]|uniref:amino acid permease n=1 Tax=Alicyclobacillus tolerans TaxID=90970 RepID=UPI001F1DC038|nr:amino acid permease [Alicyclobacillus tolerans]MCF8563453.1 amino acid permease [Alicyclobacillus tolerans]
MNKVKGHLDAVNPTNIGQQFNSTKQSMSIWELILVGVGGIIGAGYFLGSGSPIRTAGPSVLIAFLVGGFITTQTVGALNTLATYHPSEGAFKVYADMYLGRFIGYMQGWTYYLTSILTISSEAVASAIFVRLWVPSVPIWLLSSIFAAIVLLINAFGVKDFGLVESFMSVIKIAALVGFIVVVALSLFGWHVQATGTTPKVSSLFTGSFFPHGFGGLCQSMLIVIFAYAGIGVFGTAAVELKHPKLLDMGGFTTMGLLIGLYFLSIAGVLLILPWSEVSTQISPFVQAIQSLHLGLLANVLNAVILIASFSVMAGSVFSANQILASLGHGGEAPKFTIKTSENRHIHYGALITTAIGIAIFIGVSYMLPSSVYNLLISSSSFFTFFNWLIMLATLIAWRRKEAKNKVSKLAFGQPFTTWLTMVLIVVLAGYALFERDQRLGFYVSLAMSILLVVGYFFSRKRKFAL